MWKPLGQGQTHWCSESGKTMGACASILILSSLSSFLHVTEEESVEEGVAGRPSTLGDRSWEASGAKAVPSDMSLSPRAAV